MKGDELLNKMGLIDPKYIVEAEAEPRKKNNTWVRWGAVAACMCIIAGGTFVMPRAWNTPSTAIPDPEIQNNTVDGTIIEGTGKIDEYTEQNEPNGKNEAFTEPAKEPYHDNVNNGFSLGGQFGDDAFLSGKPMVSNYGEASYDADIAVENGGVLFSNSLQSAMDNHGDSANYRVLIVLFKEGKHISSGSMTALTEAQRLSELGYIVAMETYTETEECDGFVKANVNYYFTLHTTYDRLSDFETDSNLGYYVMLYGEYFGESEIGSDVDVYNNGFTESNN